MGIEEECDEVRKMLEERRIEWSQLSEYLVARAKRLGETVAEAPTFIKNLQDLLLAVTAFNNNLFNATLLSISRLGIHIAEVHERLANCEKAIKEMSNIIKKK